MNEFNVHRQADSVFYSNPAGIQGTIVHDPDWIPHCLEIIRKEPTSAVVSSFVTLIDLETQAHWVYLPAWMQPGTYLIAS